MTWGLVPDLLVESAIVATRQEMTAMPVVSFVYRRWLCTRAMAKCGTTALALDVAMGRKRRSAALSSARQRRNRPTQMVVVEELMPTTGERRVTLGYLPFATGITRPHPDPLERFKLTIRRGGARTPWIFHPRLSLLAPQGEIEVVQTGAEALLARWFGLYPGDRRRQGLLVDHSPRKCRCRWNHEDVRSGEIGQRAKTSIDLWNTRL